MKQDYKEVLNDFRNCSSNSRAVWPGFGWGRKGQRMHQGLYMASNTIMAIVQDRTHTHIRQHIHRKFKDSGSLQNQEDASRWSEKITAHLQFGNAELKNRICGGLCVFEYQQYPQRKVGLGPIAGRTLIFRLEVSHNHNSILAFNSSHDHNSIAACSKIQMQDLFINMEHYIGQLKIISLPATNIKVL